MKLHYFYLYYYLWIFFILRNDNLWAFTERSESKPVCRWKANAPITVKIPVNPTKRSAKAKLITSKNVRFSFLRWIQKANIVNMLAMRMTIVRTMRTLKNTKSVVSDITENNEWLKMNWMSDLVLYRQAERNLDSVSTSAPMVLIVEK